MDAAVHLPDHQRPMLAIPLSLTIARLLLGPLAVWMATHGVNRAWFIALLIAGLLSDIFDGVLARALGVSASWFRRLDSQVDIVFYLCILAATYLLEERTLRIGAPAIAAVVSLEALCIAVSLRKFRVMPGTHAWSAKVFGIVLFAAFLGILAFRWGPWAVWLAGAFGVAANAEVLAIIALSVDAPVDVAHVGRVARRTPRHD